MSLSITPYSPADAPDVAALQSLLWKGGVERNLQYLEWKYFRNPYLDARYMVLARSDDELVGMIGAFGAEWAIPGMNPVVLPCLADTVVMPNYRGSSLFLRMVDVLLERLTEDAVPWLLDFGDQPAGPAMLMRGWKAIGPWGIAVSSARSADAFSSGSIAGALAPSHGRRTGILLVEHRELSPSTVASFLRTLERSDRIRHVRDERYLSWRFDNPLANYTYITAGRDGMHGFLMGHRTVVDEVWGDTPTTIVDCEATSDSLWADLIEAAIERLPGRQVLLWTRDLPAGRLALLPSLGLTTRLPTGRLTQDVNLPNLLVVRTGAPLADPELVRLEDPGAWDLHSICGRSWR